MAVLNSYFIFENQFYVQQEGMGMGRPFGPTFANTFMCFHEKNWVTNCLAEFRAKMYKRCVDDCFSLFNNKQEGERLFYYLFFSLHYFYLSEKL